MSGGAQTYSRLTLDLPTPKPSRASDRKASSGHEALRTDTELREWAGENREALELFLQGADRPDAAHPAGELTASAELGRLSWVAFLEGSRRQESGDTAGV
jgi:hypothetical protein